MNPFTLFTPLVQQYVPAGWGGVIIGLIIGLCLVALKWSISLQWLYRIPAAWGDSNPCTARRADSTGEVGERLYVGITSFGRLKTRHLEHQGKKGGWQQVRQPWADRVIWWIHIPVIGEKKWCKRFITIELFWTREAVEKAELKAIAEELPTYNIIGARRRQRHAKRI